MQINCRKNVFKMLDVRNEELAKLKFVVIHFSVYGRNGIHTYIPAEVGMAAFSLELGVLDYYSTLIDPGKPVQILLSSMS